MKGIMFNGHFGLESAVLNGTKTQTRRIVKDYKLIKTGYHQPIIFNKKGKLDVVDEYGNFKEIKPPYKIGEIVAIKQSYETIANVVGHYDIDIAKTAGWKNKMFVKNERMINFIKITNIRVERLQDISEEDCLKEGIKQVTSVNGFAPFEYDNCPYDIFDTEKEAFASLINKVSGKGTWKSNPYVWVIDFELVK